MKLLLDTHILLWAACEPARLSAANLALIEDQNNSLMFSAASLWEITIKRSLGRADFNVDPRLLRRGLVDKGYEELTIGSDHALALDGLAHHHKDPFDRLLVAQANFEGLLLITSDPVVARYPGPLRLVSIPCPTLTPLT